jgi:hypothetical protein
MGILDFVRAPLWYRSRRGRLSGQNREGSRVSADQKSQGALHLRFRVYSDQLKFRKQNRLLLQPLSMGWSSVQLVFLLEKSRQRLLWRLTANPLEASHPAERNERLEKRRLTLRARESKLVGCFISYLHPVLNTFHRINATAFEEVCMIPRR